jgi:mersacidin/lichenicidin family type 2 lantibiotic
MNTTNIIRAWKDEEYRLSLSDAERAMLPPHPAGEIELTDAEMGTIVGGAHADTFTVNGEICCCAHTIQDCSGDSLQPSGCLCGPRNPRNF